VRTRKPNEELLVIGWNEYVDLPNWGIRNLRAKIDTGARTSALHVDNIEELPRDRVRFDVILDRKKSHRRVRVEARRRRHGRVRSSTGHHTSRLFVVTTVRLGPVCREVEFSLINRERMAFRMLLGRSALSGVFLVDARRRRVLGKPLRPPRTKRKRKRTG
jgi:hypothetical protein